MPFYSYTSNDGVTIEMHFTMAKRPDEVKQNGVTYTRDVAADHRSKAAEIRVGHQFPYWSETMGIINTDQIAEAKAADRRMGFDTTYNGEGQLLVPDKNFRNAYAKAQGMYDRNAYGVSGEVPHPGDLSRFDHGTTDCPV